jgi:hypothetical protein
MTKTKFFLTALQTGVPFGLVMGVFYSGRGGGAIAMGIVNGVAFGLAMAGFLAWQAKRASRVKQPYEAEGIVHDGPANHASTTSVGGWLILTKQRLIFEPHKVNVGGKRIEISRQDIVAAMPGQGLLPNKLEIVTSNHEKHSFVVAQRAVWLAQLPRAMT